MPFCPKCKVEYRKGFTMCSDCKIELVDSLDNIREETIVEPKIKTDHANIGLTDIFGGVVIEDYTEEQPVPVTQNMTEEELEEYKKFLYAKQQELNETPDDYATKAEKASDYKSTGIMLIVMGALGIVILVLFFFDLIPFLTSSKTVISYVIYGILFCFFGLFIYWGISSYRKHSEMAVEAVKEEKDLVEFRDWFKDNIKKDTIDDGLNISDDSQNNYFLRYNKIKILIKEKFDNKINDTYLDNYIDDNYEDIFQ